jgi:hypothetical protein
VFPIILSVNSDNLPKHYESVGLYNEDGLCSLRSRNLTFIYYVYLDYFRFRKVVLISGAIFLVSAVKFNTRSCVVLTMMHGNTVRSY